MTSAATAELETCELSHGIRSTICLTNRFISYALTSRPVLNLHTRRFPFSVANADPSTCRFAEFSSKWRTTFLIFVANPRSVRLCNKFNARSAIIW